MMNLLENIEENLEAVVARQLAEKEKTKIDNRSLGQPPLAPA